MNVVIVNLKSVTPDVRQFDLVQTIRFQVDDRIAVRTDEMMMLSDVRIESSRGPVMTDFRDDPYLNERIQDAIHRGARYVRNLRFDLLVDLIRSRMILVLKDRFEHHATLDGDRQAMRSACLR